MQTFVNWKIKERIPDECNRFIVFWDLFSLALKTVFVVSFSPSFSSFSVCMCMCVCVWVWYHKTIHIAMVCSVFDEEKCLRNINKHSHIRKPTTNFYNQHHLRVGRASYNEISRWMPNIEILRILYTVFLFLYYRYTFISLLKLHCDLIACNTFMYVRLHFHVLLLVLRYGAVMNTCI